MTYLTGPSIRPVVGGFYDLRAGLQCFVEATVDFYGQLCFRGVLLPPAAGTILWHDGGYYAPDRSAHELDIMKETSC
jgi:hypothetical protein